MSTESSPTDSTAEKLSISPTMDDYIKVNSGATCWHFERTPFTEDVAKKAEIELNEKPETRTEAIEAFRKMIKERADFTTQTDDAFLLRFLRARKFNLERAFRLIRNYYLAMAKYDVIFSDLRPSIIKRFLLQNLFTVLPYRDPEGRIIGIIKIGEANPGKMPFTMAVRIVALSAELISDDPVTQVHGMVLILDFSDVVMKIIPQVATPTNLRTIFVLLQDCLPARVKNKHAIFGPKIFKLGFEAGKHFMNTKMRERFVFHGDDLASLHKHIPPEILPEEYGGSLQYDRNMWMEKLLSKEERFKYIHRKGYEKKFPLPD